MADYPDKLDLQNLTKYKPEPKFNGVTATWEYKGAIYRAADGVLIRTPDGKTPEDVPPVNVGEAIGTHVFDGNAGVWNFLGIDPESAREFVSRFGLIILGSAIIIIAVAFIIAGSKTAQNVVGKALS